MSQTGLSTDALALALGAAFLALGVGIHFVFQATFAYFAFLVGGLFFAIGSILRVWRAFGPSAA
ncbi:hypothetical protein SAMN04487950_3229 [Halogranum rubrum]|uniref:Uncharacterized protein n=2 Tax=Halogranum rubrum TaxID=553466 RepID=A0A1I4GGJ9_9EURY|nr:MULTISPECIES: hypothetical protein [Halogranum]EJN59775.1 hypothetical protein HSB1_19330 [Halogranum salarium B-1]SFL28246.1 hypothetical protein SAMN04487950_3229 [Halogranum rubrum]